MESIFNLWSLYSFYVIQAPDAVITQFQVWIEKKIENNRKFFFLITKLNKNSED